MEYISEIIEYINTCDKCFAAILDDTNHPEVIFIKFKKVYDDTIVLGISKKDINYFNNLSNNSIAVTMWSKIKGYQLKGYRLLEDEENYINVINKFKNDLKESNAKLSAIHLVLCNIKAMYYVTPGTLAGKPI